MIGDPDITSLDRKHWAYGVHLPQIRWNSSKPAEQVGSWKVGSITEYRKKAGLPPGHGAWAIYKAQVAPRYEIPLDAQLMIREAVQEGFLLKVTFAEYAQSHPGPDPTKELIPLPRRARRFAKLIEDIVKTKDVVLTYLNEWNYGTNAWLGTAEEHYAREAQCARAWHDLGFHAGVGGDPAASNIVEALPLRRDALKAHGVDPGRVAMFWHGYGASGNVPLHDTFLARRTEEFGFGALVHEEAAYRVETEGPLSEELEWYEATMVACRKAQSGMGFFTLYDLHDKFLSRLRKVKEALDIELDQFVDKTHNVDAADAATISGRIMGAHDPSGDWTKSFEGRAAYKKTLALYSA